MNETRCLQGIWIQIAFRDSKDATSPALHKSSVFIGTKNLCIAFARKYYHFLTLYHFCDCQLLCDYQRLLLCVWSCPPHECKPHRWFQPIKNTGKYCYFVIGRGILQHFLKLLNTENLNFRLLLINVQIVKIRVILSLPKFWLGGLSPHLPMPRANPVYKAQSKKFVRSAKISDYRLSHKMWLSAITNLHYQSSKTSNTLHLFSLLVTECLCSLLE